MNLSRTLDIILLLTLCPLGNAARGFMGGGGGLTMKSKAARAKAAAGSSSGLDSSGGEAGVLMKLNREWSIPPLTREDFMKSELVSEYPDVADYVWSSLGRAPLLVTLQSKPVQMKGSSPSSSVMPKKFKAQVMLGSNIPRDSEQVRRVQKLRSVWSAESAQLSTLVNTKTPTDSKSPLLTKSYEENMKRLSSTSLELEIILPKRKKMAASPAIVYTFPLSPGTMSTSSRIAVSRGIVRVYPEGRKQKASSPVQDSTSTSSEDSTPTIETSGIKVGLASLHLHSGPSVIDWTWVKGKKIFWRGGRPVGQV